MIACRMLLLQAARMLFSFAEASAGRSRAARMAMMAITTSSSIRVNAPRRIRPGLCFKEGCIIVRGDLSGMSPAAPSAVSASLGREVPRDGPATHRPASATRPCRPLRPPGKASSGAVPQPGKQPFPESRGSGHGFRPQDSSCALCAAYPFLTRAPRECQSQRRLPGSARRWGPRAAGRVFRSGRPQPGGRTSGRPGPQPPGGAKKLGDTI